MAQISGTKVRIFKTVAFPVCWCPQLPVCRAEQFTLLEISILLVALMQIYIQKKERERKRDWNWKHTRLKRQQKNPKPKSPAKERLGTFFFSPLRKKLFSLIIWFAWLQSKHRFSLTLAVVASLFLVPALVCLSPLPCHRFAWARLWKCSECWQGSGGGQRASPGERCIFGRQEWMLARPLRGPMLLPARGCLESSPDQGAVCY